MRSRSQTVGAGALVAVALIACATPVQTEKGRLVPVDVPGETLARAHAPRRLALVIGIDRFDDPQWRPLRFPEADAASVAEVLRDPERGAFDDVEVLAEGPSRGEIREGLRRLADRSRDESDTVVVYVSSHGTLARDGVGRLRRYLVARDTRAADVPGTGVSMDDLKAGFFVRPIEDVSRASVVLSASDWGETAREDEKLGNDIYTHFLVEALRVGADRNGDGAVTASEAHDYARRMTYEYTGGRQRPTAESTEVGVDPIVLVGKIARRGKPELYSYAPRLDGFTVRVDGKPLANLPGGVALDTGRHRVQVAKGGGPEVVNEVLALRDGERLDLDHLRARAEGRWEIAPRLAFLSFLDARSRRDVLGAIPAFGAALTCREWPRPRMGLRLDVSTSSGSSRLEQGPHAAWFRYSVSAAGVALPWRFEPDALRGASLLAGPRLSAVWIDRRFDLALAPPQSYFTFMPGLLLGASVPIGRGLSAGAELHLNWTVLRVDGENRSSGFGELLLGAGYRF